MRGKLWAAFGAYVVILGLFALWRWHIWTYGTDTGLFTQVIADAFGGFRDGPEQGTHFRYHWAPILALLWPLVVVTHQPLALQFAQIVLIGATAFPLYAIARTYVAERAALGIACIALVYPPLAAVAFGEFHEMAFFPLVALLVFWAADRARWAAFAAFAVASALVREDTCIVFAIVGVTFAAIGIARRNAPGNAGLLRGQPIEPGRLAIAGVALAALNIIALAVYFLAVLPPLGGWEPSRFYQYAFASGPVALVASLARHPAYAGQLFTFGRLTYLLEAFVPLALLPLFSRWSLLALPGLAIVLLSSDQIAWRMGSHYAAIWIPFLLLGTLAALVRFDLSGLAVRARRMQTAAYALCAIVLIAFNPMHPLHYARPVYAEDASVREALSMIPPSAYVLTHDEWYTRIAYDHPHASVFFCPDIDYIVYADDFPNDYYRDQLAPEVVREVKTGQARLLRRFGSVGVYARQPDAGAVHGRCITSRDGRFKTLHEFNDYNLRMSRQAVAKGAL